MGELCQSGWYPDPNDNTAEVYWDGTRWHGRRKKLASPVGGQTTGPVTGFKSFESANVDHHRTDRVRGHLRHIDFCAEP